jgi:hypothetical protein
MVLVQGVVHAGSVIDAVAQEELDRLGDPVEQGAYLGGVINVAVGQDGGDDPVGHGVKADVQFAPGTPLAGTVLLHSPGPPSFRPELSTSRWIAPPGARGCAGSSSVWARRLRVEKSGTGRSRPSSWRTEPISPSVWRSAKWNTARNVRAVVIARSE